MHDTVVVLDSAGGFVYLNRAARQAAGHDPAQWIGRPLDSLFRSPQDMNQPWQTCPDSGPWRRILLVDRQGRDRLFSCTSPLDQPNREPAGFVVVGRDITMNGFRGRAAGDQELQPGHPGIGHGHDHRDRRGRHDHLFQPAAERITGYRKEEVMGRNISMFYRDRPVAAGRMTEIAAGRHAVRYEAVILDKEGREHVFSIHKAPCSTMPAS